MSGYKVKKYFSSPDPRARESGARCRRILVCGIETSLTMSLIAKQPCVIPEAGSNGVFQVKRVIGRGECDSMVNARVGGVGEEKL